MNTVGRLLTETEAAERLAVQPCTLAAWRSRGRYNLAFRRVGRCIRYAEGDIERFLEQRRVGGEDERAGA